MFTFNGDDNDLEQVTEWLPEFTMLREEIMADIGYPYNDCFNGRIPGIMNTEKRGPDVGTHEEMAIYLLQGLHRKRENAERIAAALADGCEPIVHVDGVMRFSRVIVYVEQDRMSGSIWQEWQDARLVPETKPEQAECTGRIRAVLPKGRRRHGTLVNGRKVMVKR